MNSLKNICRTCGKTSDSKEHSLYLYPIYNSKEFPDELKLVAEEFNLWNLNIAEDDGMPQKICSNCYDSFCKIHNFRITCQDTQARLAELCTNQDIKIGHDDDDVEIDVKYLDGYNPAKPISDSEPFQFPGKERCETITSDKKEADQQDVIAEIDPVLQYQCEYCTDLVYFDDPDHLNLHYNEFHSSNLPLSYSGSKKHCDTKGKRNSHAKLHCKPCKICNKKIRGGKRMIAQHNELYHIQQPRECKTCGKKFEKITLKRFNYHMRWHDDSKLHKCKYCEKKFIQTTHLLVHERIHTGECPYLCSQCGVGFKNSGLLYAHTKVHDTKEVQCPNCPKKFHHSIGLKLHMKIHDPNRTKLQCNTCEKSFCREFNLRLHEHKRHGAPATNTMINILRKRDQNKAPLIKPHKCSRCTRSFVLQTELLKHLKIHDEDRPYSCDQCEKTYKREAHLKLHINSIHLNMKPHVCSHCGWAFAQKINLKEHIAAKHEDKRDFKCDVCGKGYAIAKMLKVHKLKHEDNFPFSCTVCDKSFRQIGILKLHMNLHLRKNEVQVTGDDVVDSIT